MIDILPRCKKEISEFPESVRENITDAAARLDLGQILQMPLSRPMPSIGKGVHELRFKDRSGIYRVIYVLLGKGTIWFLHAFTKKTEKTPDQNIEVAKKRLREIL
jgi:phage-related protein